MMSMDETDILHQRVERNKAVSHKVHIGEKSLVWLSEGGYRREVGRLLLVLQLKVQGTRDISAVLTLPNSS